MMLPSSHEALAGNTNQRSKFKMNLSREGFLHLLDIFGEFGGKEKKGRSPLKSRSGGVTGGVWELFSFTYPHISGLGTHHGGCGGRGEDGGRGQTGGEGREGVLVGVLVLVHVLVLVKLGPQERHRGQRRGGRPPAPL